MKVILTHEVSKLGEPGDVVDVKPGYARNYLIPNKLAAAWTRGAEKQIEAIRKGREKRATMELEGAQQAKGQLEAHAVTVQAKAGNHGRLFGAVTTADIAQAIEAAGAGAQVDRRRIEVAQPIKTAGEHTVSVRLHPEVVATVRLNVVGTTA